MIDRTDLALVKSINWTIHSAGYAKGYLGGRQVLMHKLLLPKAKEVDHINRDRLDNRRSNLREVTRTENCMNKGKLENTSSRFKGVSWHSQIKTWRARLGNFQITTKDEIEAAYIYDQAVLQMFGKHAFTNFDLQ